MMRYNNGEVKSRKKIGKLHESFSISRKGIGTVIWKLFTGIIADYFYDFLH